MRIALVVEHDFCRPTHRRHALIAALAREFSDSVLFPVNKNHATVADELSGRRGEFDCALTFLYFDALYDAREAFKTIELPFVMIEHDILLNYSDTNSARGKFSAFFSQCPVDLLVLSGLEGCSRLRAEGKECLYSPKAAPESFLSYPNRYTGFYCAFGSHRDAIYSQRARLYERFAPRDFSYLLARGFPQATVELRQRLTRQTDQVQVHRLRFSFRQMPRLLSLYSGCLICDTGLLEPMAKHFEAGALGVVPFRDRESEYELTELGYRDGESMVIYDNGDDLEEKLRYYHSNAGALRKLQDGARRATVPNTWENRARDLRGALEARY